MAAQIDTSKNFLPNAQLTINSLPNGASVFVNDTLLGTTPLTIFTLPKHEKRLRLVLAGYKEWNYNFAILKESQNFITVIMDDRYGILSISSDPMDAEVFLNDSLIGKTPIEEVKLDRRTYNVKIKKKDFETYERELSPQRILMTISPKLASNISYISFNKNLNTEKVYIDGKEITNDSLELRTISKGIHQIDCSQPGTNRTLSENINFQADKLYSIRLATDPIIPSLYSALIPGAGQIYNGSYLKGLTFFSGALVSGIILNSAINNYDIKYKSTTDAQNLYLNSNDEAHALYYRNLVLQSRADADDALRYKRIAIGVFLSIYLYNLFDVLFFEPNDFLKISVSNINIDTELGFLSEKPNYKIGLKFPIK